MIYCDGERDLFHEDEFIHQKDGNLFRPYIHRGQEHIPEHFADGGYPVAFADPNSPSDPVSLQDSSLPPIAVAALSLLKNDQEWRAIQQSLAPDPVPKQAQIDLHFAGLDWPPPIETASGDPKVDTTKALYQAQLQLVASQQQSIIDHDKAVRASDYAFHQAVFQAYLDVAKGQIDRSVTRTQFLTTAASAIATIYAAIIGLSFGMAQANHTLPAVGIAPAIFLGLSIALAAYYLAYITAQTHLLQQATTTQTSSQTTLLPIQRLFDERNHLIEWVATTVVNRVQWLHAAIISLAIGIVFLPAPFVALPGWLIWSGVVIGVLVVFIPPVRYFSKPS